MRPSPRLLLIDPSDSGRAILADRLRLQGFGVIECRDGAEGALQALEDPPAAVIADLSMPSISGAQLCRLLHAEAGTANVPVVLRGSEGRRNHFWAEQAGAFAYVVKGRMGELVRALRRAIAPRAKQGSGQLCLVRSTDGLDARERIANHLDARERIANHLDARERIANHLDAALFESVIAAEVRKLASSESFDRLVDLLSQFLSQVTSYRWLAIQRKEPLALGLHVNPVRQEEALAEAQRALSCEARLHLTVIGDDDAVIDAEGPPAIVMPIAFGDQVIGSLALAPCAPAHPDDPLLVKTLARELGGALRMATLVEESRHLASTDALTGLLNRRAFNEWAAREVLRSGRYRDSFSVILFDLDHFKQINDRRGHPTGDAVLSGVARMLSRAVRSCDVASRWGGEEFMIALPSTPLGGAMQVAERMRAELEAAQIRDPENESIPITASFGVAEIRPDEQLEHLIDRADRAMHAAKSAGRNRVFAAGLDSVQPAVPAQTLSLSPGSAQPSSAQPVSSQPGSVQPSSLHGSAPSA